MSIRNLLIALVVLLPAPLAAQGITIPNTFVNGTAADATQVNANFTSLANNALNRTGGTMSGTLTTLLVQPAVSNTSDVGTTSLLYRTAYVRTSLVLGQAAANYTVTWANPGGARAISFEDPGGTDILVYKAATQTLTNKTLTAPVLSGTATGTYTLAGTPTLSGTFVGSYTMGGTGVWNAGAVTSSGLLTVNGNGTHNFSAAGPNVLQVTATSTASFSGLSAVAGAMFNGLTSYGTTSGGAGHTAPGSLLAYSNGAGGLSVAAMDAAGTIRFYSGGTTLRGTVDAAGTLVWAGTMSVAGASGVGPSLVMTYVGNVTQGITINDSNAGTGTQILFARAGTTVGTIVTTAGATAYNTSSDRRLKDDRGLSSDLSHLRALAIHDFVWTADGTRDRGVFAQEAQPWFPRAITIGTDARNAAGQLVQPWMVDYSKFVPDLIVGWQQHDARIAALEAQVKDAGSR